MFHWFPLRHISKRNHTVRQDSFSSVLPPRDRSLMLLLQYASFLLNNADYQFSVSVITLLYDAIVCVSLYASHFVWLTFKTSHWPKVVAKSLKSLRKEVTCVLRIILINMHYTFPFYNNNYNFLSASSMSWLQTWDRPQSHGHWIYYWFLALWLLENEVKNLY